VADLIQLYEKLVGMVSKAPLPAVMLAAGLALGVLMTAALAGYMVTIEDSKVILNKCCTDKQCKDLKDKLEDAAKQLILDKYAYARSECRSPYAAMGNTRAAEYLEAADELLEQHAKTLPARNWGNKETFVQARDALKQGDLESACALYGQAFAGLR
jgi:hypothetical protein